MSGYSLMEFTIPREVALTSDEVSAFVNAIQAGMWRDFLAVAVTGALVWAADQIWRWWR